MDSDTRPCLLMPSLSLDLAGFYVGHVVHLFGDYAALFATESGLFFRYRQLNVGHHPSTITRSTSIRPLHHLAIIYTSISRSLRLNISSVERCIYPYSAALLPRQSLISYFSPSLSPDQLARPSDRGHCMHHRAVNIITTVYCLLTKKIYNSFNEKLNSYSQCPLTLMIHDTAVLFPRGIAISGKRKKHWFGVCPSVCPILSNVNAAVRVNGPCDSPGGSTDGERGQRTFRTFYPRADTLTTQPRL